MNGTRRRGWTERPFAPVDIASLAFFRFAFGAIMVWEVWRYLSKGRIFRYWIDPSFHFTYYGFEWVQPWPGIGMYIHWVALGVLGAMLAVGLFYRTAALLFFLGFTYTFLLEQARYLNHFYLVAILSLLLVFVPAHRAFSLDALRRPELRSDTTPAWSVWLLRAQLGIVYVYAALAKLNQDWLAGEPMRSRLARRDDYPVLGAVAHEEWAVHFFSYGGILFNLLVVPALLWRRTRVAAFVVATGFHLMNAWIYTIGIFPWLMIAATTIFFEPDWPRRAAGRARRLVPDRLRFLPARWSAARRAWTKGVSRPAGGLPSPSPRHRALVLGLLGAWLAVQLLVPLRHHLYDGHPAWTEEGHRFSWRMMLRSKTAVEVSYLLTHPERGISWRVDPYERLTPRQARKAFTRPDMVLQYAHHLAEDAALRGYEGVEVRALVLVSLNNRRVGLLVDPEVDLARVPRSLRAADWILPMEAVLSEIDGGANP